tara:strand:+ start:34999 stop:35775 length:777 start_codon:yes stop_codon:yes gene_type:complete
MEYRKIKGKRHYIFDNIEEYQEHFKEEALPVCKDWRDGEENQWVYSDDDRILQLLKVSDLNHPNDRKNYKWAKNYVRTIVGTFVNNKNTFMDTDFDQHPNRYTFSKKIKYTNMRVKKRKKVTNNEKIFATNVVTGMGPVKAYMDAFKGVSDENKAKKKALVLLKQERVMQEIEKTVLDVAKELGVDHKYVLNRLKCLADNSEDDNIILQSTKELGKIIGTSVNTVKHKDVGVFGVFQGFSPEQLEGAKQAVLPEKIDG